MSEERNDVIQRDTYKIAGIYPIGENPEIVWTDRMSIQRDSPRRYFRLFGFNIHLGICTIPLFNWFKNKLKKL